MKISALGFPWQTEDPFLFCVHHLDFYPSGNEKMEPSTGTAGRYLGNDFRVMDGWRMYHGHKIPGFPYHPHRGFETITIAEQGVIDHSDSTGGAGRFSKGDAQWMTAGKGILHSEMFPLVHQEKDNTLEIFQIWLNLPAKDKLVEPHFKMLWNEDTPTITLDEGKIELKLVAGTWEDTEAPSPPPHSWAHDSENGVEIFIIKMKKGARMNFGLKAQNITRNLYFYQGEQLRVNNTSIPHYHSVAMESKEEYTVYAESDCSLLYLAGKAINEPIAQRGPFVMNTEEELEEGFREYRRTGFGKWPWPMEEQVHGTEKQRFAIHSDGRKEEKGEIE